MIQMLDRGTRTLTSEALTHSDRRARITLRDVMVRLLPAICLWLTLSTPVTAAVIYQSVPNFMRAFDTDTEVVLSQDAAMNGGNAMVFGPDGLLYQSTQNFT